MPTLLENYQTERDSLLATIQTTVEGVQGRDLSEAETRSISDAQARIGVLDSQIALVSGAADLTRNFQRSERRERAASSEVRSIGEQFTGSEQFRAYRGHGSSTPVTVELRALPTGTADVDGLYRVPQRVDVTPPTATPLLDALRSITVSGNAIETVVWEKTAGGAAIVPEKGAKPAVEFAPTVVPFTLDTIAGYTQMTRQLMEDEPAIRDTINGYLMRDVALKMESEAAAAIAGATFDSVTATGAQGGLLAAIRKGIGALQAKGYFPGAVLLNPEDWADLDISVFNGSSSPGTPIQRSFWGVTPIAVASQPAGTALVADLGSTVQHYRRSGVSLYVTDSHADTFLSNVFTVLAEARAKTIVTRPDAAVECSAV